VLATLSRRHSCRRNPFRLIEAGSRGKPGEAEFLTFAGKAGSWYPFGMEPPRRLHRFLSRLVEAATGLLRPEKPPPSEPPPVMIGLPPSARELTGRPADIVQHAQQVARDWEDVAEDFVQTRMRELGIPDHQIGSPDYRRGGEKHAFLPDETIGGSNGIGRRLFVDSGVLNPDLNTEVIGPEASKLWTKSRLRDRIDAVTAHEHLEAQGIPHDEVVQRAPDTELPIGENARRILRSMAEGVNRQGRR
jgi:hypothetical protein